MTTVLTGIKPTGTPHIGNYLGAIKPALALAEAHDARYFIADYHALTTVRDAATLRDLSYQVAATWLACGLDPERVIFYRQSDVPETFELTWVLSCFAGKGWLNRAHAYKAAVDANVAAGMDPDDGVTMGLFNYPVLMAADILLFDTDRVPVGRDQQQHLEITRDIAAAFNHVYGDVLRLPEAVIPEGEATITGLDGRKMSKSYDNTINIFAPPKQLRKQVMRIVTDSRTPDDPKDPDACNIYAIYRYFAEPDALASVREAYLNGGLAYGAMKQTLFETLDAAFAPARERYNALMADTDRLDAILMDGAARARTIAAEVLGRVRSAVGTAFTHPVERTS
jgi:tryptophanyl-tRNA synthetase